MKKKQLTSVLLAGIMILSLCVPAFADEGGGSEGGASTGGQSTNVEYTASNNESYLLTVPASLAPGGSDTVKLEGNWPSTRTMKVSADANVVLTNSINANDKKTLTVSFNEIALAGNNNETVSATEEVSVQDITNANFGEWSGRFSYYVNSEGTGADEPITHTAPTMAIGQLWYKSDYDFNSLTSIKFVDSYFPTGSEDETWFADKDNGTVSETVITAYRTGTEVIVAGNGSGKIMANEDSNRMFNWGYGVYSDIRTLDISILDTSNVVDMSYMFMGCGNLSSIDVSHFDVSNVKNISFMFNMCAGITSLDLSNFNISIDKMRNVFGGCDSLVSLDLSGLDTSKVTDMWGLFDYCSNLTTIYVGSGWNTDMVTDSEKMFKDCTSLPNFDSSVVDKTNAHTGEGGYLTLKA